VGIPEIESYPLPTAAELPINVAKWTVDTDRAVLLVHDMQRYFTRPLPPHIEKQLVANTAGLVARARASAVPVAYTAHSGRMTERQRGLLKDFWGPGMRTDPSDREIVDPLTPAPGDWLLTKWRYSAFFRTDLLHRMRISNRDQLVVCGVYAHVGVLMTAADAFGHDIETFVVADAVADFSAGHHHQALTYAAGRCAVVLMTEEVW
jgi:isochorismate hydrolase